MTAFTEPEERIELRKQVEAGQGGVKALAQPRAHLLFHQLGAGEHPQPQPQRLRVLAVGARFHVHATGPFEWI